MKTAGLLGLVAVSATRVPTIFWEWDPYHASAILFREAGRQPDLTGIAAYGMGNANAANFFFLSKDVPLVTCVDQDYYGIVQDADWVAGRMNYIVCNPKEVHRFAEWQPAPMASRNEYVLYRLGRPSSAPAGVASSTD
jgi:hypothetical protein